MSKIKEKIKTTFFPQYVRCLDKLQFEISRVSSLSSTLPGNLNK